MNNTRMNLVALALSAGTVLTASAVPISNSVDFVATAQPLNGNFEATPFSTSWVNGGGIGTLTAGLNGTAQAVYMNHNIVNEFSQNLTPLNRISRLDFFFAAEDLSDTGGPRASFDMRVPVGSTPGDANGAVQLRVVDGGRLQYQTFSLGYQNLITDFAYSVDADNDLDFTSPGDTLNVYRVRLDMLIDGANSRYDLFVSEANMTTFTDSVLGAEFSAIPTTAIGISEIKLRNDGFGRGDFVVDELVISVPEPASIGLILMGLLAFRMRRS